MSDDVFNSNQSIPETLKKKQNMDNFPVNFFLHEGNWGKELFCPK